MEAGTKVAYKRVFDRHKDMLVMDHCRQMRFVYLGIMFAQKL